jgi:uracil phosphoribosyltransferase
MRAPPDSLYRRVPFRPSEFQHHYGPRVHLVADPLCMMLLARFSKKGTVQPEINRLLVELYRTLVHDVVASEFPRSGVEIETRMIDHTPQGVWAGEAVDPATRTVVVAVARAGLVPSQICFDYLNQFLDPVAVRQDHLILERQVDAEGRVTGAALHGSKIGGSVDDAIVIIPDPMGATGSTVTRVLEQYQPGHRGRPRKVIAVHLIITPEYLLHVTSRHPEVEVYALRVDRGLSPPEVLAAAPGERWSEERGLNEHHYIVPGAGGVGELINNAFV